MHVSGIVEVNLLDAGMGRATRRKRPLTVQ
jgi:hypothetical protein